jgi:L-fuculose-phosphate aldolase
MQENLIEQFQQVGEDLIRHGLTTSHGGNMSVRQSGRMIVTAHFAMLGRLGPGDLLDVPLREEPDHIAGDVSKDTDLHQLIYRFTPAGAVIHAHPAHAVALSLCTDSIAPRDLEGSLFLKEVPVVAMADVATRLPQVLQTHVAAVVRGHGCYVVGRTLSEALAFCSALELSCRIDFLSAQCAARGGKGASAD